jgi:Putative sensor
MNRSAPRSIDQYLKQLREELAWTTLAYLILMLPLGIVYFVVAVVGLSVSLAFIFAPLIEVGGRLHATYAKALLVARTAP